MQTPLSFAVDNRLPDILERVRQLFPSRRPAEATNPIDQLLYAVIGQGLPAAAAMASYLRIRAAYPGLLALRQTEPKALRGLMIGVPSAALKASAVPEILRLIDEAFGCLSLDALERLDDQMALRFLTRLPRVTEEIALSVLRFSGRERTVMSVDADVARPLRRLSLAEPGAPLSALPRQLIERAPIAWRSADFSDLSRGLGRVADRWCHQGKPACAACPLASLCPTAEKKVRTADVVSFPSGRDAPSRAT